MRKWLIGFDIGGTKCAAILGKVEAENFFIVQKTVFATQNYPDPLNCIEKFSDEIKKILELHPEAKPEAIGISCGGPLDSKKGIIISPPNLPGWDDVPWLDGRCVQGPGTYSPRHG